MKDNGPEKKQFAKIMWALAEDFGGKISNESLKLRFLALKEYSIDQVSYAGTWLLKHRKNTFPAVPTTKEIIDVIESWNEPKISIKAKAEIEVDKVLSKLKHHGRAGIADFEDPITQRLMTTRWPYREWASNVKTDEIKWFRRDFIEIYQAYSEKNDADNIMLDAPTANQNQIPVSNLKRLINKKEL